MNGIFEWNVGSVDKWQELTPLPRAFLVVEDGAFIYLKAATLLNFAAEAIKCDMLGEGNKSLYH